MLARRIIPCLDVKDGRVVKGINFLELRDAGDPVEQAAAYDAQGADELCYLDITASPEGRSTIVDIVERTADQVFMPLTVGGGVRSVADAERLLARRRRQDRGQHRGDPHARARRARSPRGSATRRSSSPSTRSARGRRARLGGLQPRRPHARGPRRARVVQARSPTSAPASCS